MSVSDGQVNKDTSQDSDVDAWTDVSFGEVSSLHGFNYYWL